MSDGEMLRAMRDAIHLFPRGDDTGKLEAAELALLAYACCRPYRASGSRQRACPRVTPRHNF